jgi:hypothetical protein
VIGIVLAVSIFVNICLRGDVCNPSFIFFGAKTAEFVISARGGWGSICVITRALIVLESENEVGVFERTFLYSRGVIYPPAKSPAGWRVRAGFGAALGLGVGSPRGRLRPRRRSRDPPKTAETPSSAVRGGLAAVRGFPIGAERSAISRRAFRRIPRGAGLAKNSLRELGLAPNYGGVSFCFRVTHWDFPLKVGGCTLTLVFTE